MNLQIIYGLQRSSLSNIELGKAPITDRSIIAICSKYNVNEEWLRTGNGNMFNEPLKQYNEFFEIFNKFPAQLQDFLIRTAKDLLET